MSLEFNASVGTQYVDPTIHHSSVLAESSDKANDLKRITLLILKNLAENGIGTWQGLEKVAVQCGIEDPKGAQRQFLGGKTLEKGAYFDEDKGIHLIAETLFTNSHLPLDFTPFHSLFRPNSSANRVDLNIFRWMTNKASSGKRIAESGEEIISSAPEKLGLSPLETLFFKETILSAINETPYLKAFFIPSLQSLLPEDREGLTLTGSQDALMVELIILALKKKTPEPSALTTEAKLLLIKCLPNRLALKLNTKLTTAPKDTESVLADLCRLQNVNLGVEGYARNSWEMYAKDQFQRMRNWTNESPLSLELSNRWLELTSLQPENKPASWIQDLQHKGWEADRILGRTHIYKHRETGRYLAIKWQKSEEDLTELFKEQVTLEVVRKHQGALGLLSQYPEPIGVFRFEGQLLPDYFDKTKIPIKAQDPSQEKIAYVYEFPDESYFSYLHDPKEEEDTKIVSEKYSLARRRMIADLFTLAKNGLIMTQLADLFHRSEQSRQARDDRGRFLAMNFLVRSKQYALIPDQEGFTGVGNGRLHHLETAVQYPNAGYSGLRDIGDSHLLKEFANPEFPLNKQHFEALLREKPQIATTCILANFLAEYLLVYELIITERRHLHKENQLDWQDPGKVSELANELKEGFILGMRHYSGISQTVAKRFVENASIDWQRAARQLHFFSRKDEKGYLPYNTEDLMPKEVLEKVVTGGFSTFWDSKLGMVDWNTNETEASLVRHRGTMSGTDPVKEPERARVILMTHMFLLEEAKEEAIALKLKADKLLKTASTPSSSLDNAQENILEAERLYQESLEFWPYDKAVYKSLAQIYTRRGDLDKAESYRREWAVLVLQNKWETRKKNR